MDAKGNFWSTADWVQMCRYVRKKIGSSMSLRLTPEIRFVYDEAHDRGERVRRTVYR